MNPFLESGIVAAVTCFASLLVTFIFNNHFMTTKTIFFYKYI